MRNVVRIACLAMLLAGCDAFDTLTSGFRHAASLAAKLEAEVGAKPSVSFQWTNGRLVQVGVIFPQIMTDRSLSELGELTRRSTLAEFRQTPGQIVLGFAVSATPKPEHRAAAARTL